MENMTAIIRTDQEDLDIYLSDGGVASLHHNGSHMVTTYYQSRIKDINNPNNWEILSEGKVYTKDWEDRQEADDDMILDAIIWLGGDEETIINKED